MQRRSGPNTTVLSGGDHRGYGRAFLSDLRGYALLATDGEIGRVSDSLIDDVDWVVRYFVVETGSWLLGRRVLISGTACRYASWRDRQLVSELSKDRIEKAPPASLDEPVSREYEAELRSYYGWPAWVPVPAPGQIPPSRI